MCEYFHLNLASFVVEGKIRKDEDPSLEVVSSSSSTVHFEATPWKKRHGDH